MNKEERKIVEDLTDLVGTIFGVPTAERKQIVNRVCTEIEEEEKEEENLPDKECLAMLDKVVKENQELISENRKLKFELRKSQEPCCADWCADCNETQCKDENLFEVDNVLINTPKKTVTIVKDGKPFVVKASGPDEFDVRIGYALAMMHAIFGSRTKYNKFIEKLCADHRYNVRVKIKENEEKDED